MAILPSAPIDQFDPYNDPKEGDFLAVVEKATGRTKKVDAKYFGKASPSTNYKWVSTFDYPEDYIVEHLGKWYLSLQTPNLGQNPATSPLYWEEQNKSSGSLVNWQAGIYTGEPVLVLRVIGGITYIAKLKSATRPYLSSNFETELAAEDWEIVGGLDDGGGSSIVFVDRETPAGAINGVNTVFTLSDIPQAGSEHVYLNGILQSVTADYTIVGDTITFVIAPETGDTLRVSYRLTASSDFVDKETPGGTINSVNNIFTLADIPVAGSEHIYLNGILQDDAADYSIAGDTITFTTAPETGDNLKASYRI